MSDSDRRLPWLRAGLLPEEESAALGRAAHLLRTARQALIFAECPNGWRPFFELNLALGMLPDRRVRVAELDAPSWEELVYSPPPSEDNAVVWLVRVGGGEGFARVFAALNLRRDEVMVPGRRVWVWVESNDLERVVQFAPDLWRYRTLSISLHPNLIEDAGLPSPLPGIAWPWSWRTPGSQPP